MSPRPLSRVSFAASQRAEPWLGKEMAGEGQVGRFVPSIGRFSEDPHPSHILQTRSEPGHRLGELYEVMLEKDPDLAGIIAKRVEAVLRLPRMIVPSNDTPAARETAEFCHEALEQIDDLAVNLDHQM